MAVFLITVSKPLEIVFSMTEFVLKLEVDCITIPSEVFSLDFVSLALVIGKVPFDYIELEC